MPSPTRATARECVKRIAMAYAASTKAHKFTEVSDSFLTAVEINAINFIKDRVNRHPGKGKRLK